MSKYSLFFLYIYKCKFKNDSKVHMVDDMFV